jgi:hypothetical protein
MPATGAKPAFGALLTISISGTPTTVAEITKITPPGQKRDVIEATNMESPSGAKEYIKGLFDAGEVGVEGNYTSVASQDALRTDFVAGTLQAFTITIPVSTPETWSFSAIITEYGLGEMTPDGKLTFKATLKISGVITVT